MVHPGQGRTFDADTVSRFDLGTCEVVEVASFDNHTGKGPESALLVLDNEGYFTTQSGGTGNAGTIAKLDFDTGSITVLFHSICTRCATAREDCSPSDALGLVQACLQDLPELDPRPADSCPAQRPSHAPLVSRERLCDAKCLQGRSGGR